MKTVAFVPIRLNSKRIVGKNLKYLGNKPLMAYVFETLCKVPEINEIYAYCSQTSIIEHLPSKVKFLKRSETLDGDETLGEEIYSAFVNEVDADIYILTHTTSPFLKNITFSNALKQILTNGYDSAFSAEKIQTFAWFESSPINYDLKHIPRTQDISPVFVETSGFYMFKKEIWVQEKQRIGSKPYIQVVDKIEGLDIDYEEDFKMAECIIKYDLPST